MMTFVSEIAGAAEGRAGRALPVYRCIFETCTRNFQPAFFSTDYGNFFWHCATTIPNWLPRVVLACAQSEGHGAHELLKIASQVHTHEKAATALIRHAKDEAGHSKLFLKLAEYCFPNSYAPGAVSAVRRSIAPIDAHGLQKSRRRISKRMLLDYLMQLNIVEIRTRLHLHLLAPMYFQLCPDEKKPLTEKILNALAFDETSHVAYTAEFINDWIDQERDDLDRMVGVFACRLEGYHEHTLEHSDPNLNDYGQGHFAALFGH